MKVIKIKESEFKVILEQKLNEWEGMTAFNVGYPLPNEFNDFQYDLEESDGEKDNTIIGSPGYDVFKDPMAIVVINYIMEKEDIEVGLMDVEPFKTYKDGSNHYYIKNYRYVIVPLGNRDTYGIDWVKYDNYYIYKVI